jgi:hypothetical protein
VSLALTLEGAQFSVVGAGLVGLSFAAVNVGAASRAAARSQIVTIEECRNLQDHEVRSKLAELTSKALAEELKGVNYRELVEIHWNQSRVNEKLDREIDDAVTAIRADTSWVERAYSTVSRESATKFATAVADRAYNSEGFRNALADLAASIGKDVGGRLEKAANEVASPVIACVQSTLQARYGAAVADVFSQETQSGFKVKPEIGGAKITSGDIVFNTAPTVAGIALVVTRRIVGQMIASIGKRVAGMVASRIAASVTGFIGLALIAADVYRAGEGVFPIITDRMKSSEAKDLIKNEIAATIAADVKQQTILIGQETAERLFSFWLDFKQKYEKLLSLSDRNPQFAEFLRDRRVDQLAKLAQVASVVIGSEGEDSVLRRAADGSLSRALTDLDATGVKIMTEKKSVDIALRWTEVAGRNLEEVGRLGLYKSLSPDDVTSEELGKLLKIDDRVAVTRMVGLDRPAREALLALPLDQVRDLARKLRSQELDAFADYQRRLPPPAAARVVRAIAEDSRIMRLLAGSGVRQAIFDSKDQGAAVEMLVRDEFPGYSRISSDFKLVKNGNVHFWVFWHAYWTLLAAMAFLAMAFLLWLRRLLFGRPTRIVVHTSKE